MSPISFEKNEHKQPDFLALNPMGKLPTIIHHDTVVTETGAIIAYLADAFPPAGPRAGHRRSGAGRYYRWLFFGAGCIEPALIDRMMKRPDVERKSALGYGSYEDVLNAMAGMLPEGPVSAGETLDGGRRLCGARR